MFQENTLQPKGGLSSICYKNSLFRVWYSVYRVTHIHGCCLFTSLEQWTDPCSSSVKWGTRFLHLTHGRLRLIGSDPQYQLTQGLYSQIGLAVSQRASRCQNHIFFWQNCYLPDTKFFTARQENEMSTQTLSPGLISPTWEGTGCPLDKRLFP